MESASADSFKNVTASGYGSPQPLTDNLERQQTFTDAVRISLRFISESPEFARSWRCRSFLEYVVEQTLMGLESEIKERTLGMELFGLSGDADLSANTIVRVTARDVRRRLRQYYATPQGHATDIQIELNPGSYVPEFSVRRHVSASEAAAELDAPSLALEQGVALRPPLKPVVWVSAGVALGFLAAFFWQRR